MGDHLSEKIDVFSFGILAREIVSRRRGNTDTALRKKKMYLLEWVSSLLPKCVMLSNFLTDDQIEIPLIFCFSQTWQLYGSDRELELVDVEEIKRVIRVGMLCTQTAPGQRPPKPRVVAMLSGDVEVGTVPAKPGYLTDLVFDDASFQNTTISSYGGLYTTTTSTATTTVPSDA